MFKKLSKGQFDWLNQALKENCPIWKFEYIKKIKLKSSLLIYK